MANRAMSLLIVSWAFIAVAVRLEQDSGSVVANAAVGQQNLTAVVGTHGSDRGVLSRADLAISPGDGLAVAAAAYLPRVIGLTRHGTVPAAFGDLEAIQARSAPGNNVANNTLQDLFTPVPSDQGVTDNLFGQAVEKLVATNRELQKEAEGIFALMVYTLSSVEAPEDQIVTLADKLMKLGKTMVQRSSPSLIYEDIVPKASQSKTPLQMAGRRVVDNTLMPLAFAHRKSHGNKDIGAVREMQWKSNMRRLAKALGLDDEDGFDKENVFDEATSARGF